MTIACPIAVALLAALRFSPILGSSLSDADGYLQHLSAVAGFDRITTSTVYLELAHHSRTLVPGWFPLAPLPLAIWLADVPRQLAKLVQLLLVAGSFGTFCIVARQIFRSSNAAVFASVVALTAWQLRTPHDPIVGTSFVAPLLAETILLAYAAWFAFRASGKIGWLALSCIAVVAAMLSDPLGWALCALLGAQALVERPGRRAAFALPVTVLVIFMGSMLLGLPRPPWIRAGPYFQDVVAQLIAPWPASYRAFGYLPLGHVGSFWHGNGYVDDRFINVSSVNALGWLSIVCSTAVAFFSLANSRSTRDWQDRRRSLLFGLGFWVLPALVLGPAVVWRGGTPVGQSFDCVYLQYFGIGVLLTAALLRVREQAARAGSLAPALSALTVMLLCYGNARADAGVMAKTHRLAASRDLLERAGSAGFFQALPSGTTIAVSPLEPFANGLHSSVSDAKYAIYHFSKRRFEVISTTHLDQSRRTGAWILETAPSPEILASLGHWARNQGQPLLVDRAYGYSVFPTFGAALGVRMRGLEVELSPLEDGFVIHARRTCGPVPLDMAYAAAVPTFSWGRGFYQRGLYGFLLPESNRDAQVYMQPSASLALQPTTCKPRPLIFHAIVASDVPSTLVVTVLKRRQRFTVAAIPQPLTVRTPTIYSPVRMFFSTDASPLNLEPLPFRYEHDRPRDVRMTFTAASVAEASPPPSHRRGHRERPAERR